jgi:hypothetical protein
MGFRDVCRLGNPGFGTFSLQLLQSELFFWLEIIELFELFLHRSFHALLILDFSKFCILSGLSDNWAKKAPKAETV